MAQNTQGSGYSIFVSFILFIFSLSSEKVGHSKEHETIETQGNWINKSRIGKGRINAMAN